MKPEEIAALERLCPYAAELEALREKLRASQQTNTVAKVDFQRKCYYYIPAIAACIVRLGEDVKLWKDRTIHAYSDGYKAAEENIRKERGNDFDASVRKYKAGRR